MDPIQIAFNLTLGAMIIGSLLWLYRIDKIGLLVLLSALAMGGIGFVVAGLTVLAIVFHLTAILLENLGIQLQWIGWALVLVLVGLAIKGLIYFYNKEHQGPIFISDFEKILLKHRKELAEKNKTKLFPDREPLQIAKDLLDEFIFVTSKRWLFLGGYCVLILGMYAIIDIKFSPSIFDHSISATSNPVEFYVRKELVSFWFYFEEKEILWLLNVIQIAAFIALCAIACWAHFKYLNWHAKNLYVKLQKYCSDLESNNQYLIWYGMTRSESLILEIEDKLRWRKDYAFVRSNKYGEGLWLSPTHSFNQFLVFAEYIKRDGVEALHKVLNFDK